MEIVSVGLGRDGARVRDAMGIWSPHRADVSHARRNARRPNQNDHAINVIVSGAAVATLTAT